MGERLIALYAGQPVNYRAMSVDTESSATHDLQSALAGFSHGLQELRTQLAGDEALTAAIFDRSDDWSDLLTYKLAPHFEGEGCLIAAVTGGTNTGKSTAFNLLLGAEVSPMMATAAATRHPLLAAHADRAAQCMEGRLVPEFKAQLVGDGMGVVSEEVPEDAMFVAETDTLPPDLMLLDTPDVDSIDRRNWKVADHIRAAGDVLVAVLTAEKYRDERVVSFFKQASESGRVVIPLMNKANPADDYAVARQQLADFCSDVDIDSPRFVLPHDFSVADDLSRTIPALDGDTDLRGYLESLDIPTIKRRVYQSSLNHFVREADAFLEGLDDVADVLSAVREEFFGRAQVYAQKYDPVPGTEIGGLFHQYVQERRGPIRRAIGRSSKAVTQGAVKIGRTLTGALRRRSDLEGAASDVTDASLREKHAEAITQITRDLITSLLESRPNVGEPAGHLVGDELGKVDIDATIAQVVDDALKAEDISEEFRTHAKNLLDSWWEDNTGKRKVLEGLDAVLAVAPAAIAAPFVFSAGVGGPEAVFLAGPLVEQFLARVIEYQFGDEMFDFLSPWTAEQRASLTEALQTHIARPALGPLLEYCEVLNGETVEELKQWQDQCARALATS
jgi:hypothetical protein